MRSLLLPAALLVPAALAWAQPVTSYTDMTATAPTLDGIIGVDEYGIGNEYAYFGSGTGFQAGGGLGAATMYLKSSVDTLFVAFENLAFDNATNQYLIYFQTGPGGFQTNGGMADLTDNGRANVSRLTRDGIDTIAFPATHALLFGQSGDWHAFFELQPVGRHTDVAVSVVRNGSTIEFGIPLSLLGVTGPQEINFQALLISDDGYLSDEGIPALISATVDGSPIEGNPGYGTSDSSHNFPDYNSFTLNPQAVPEPAVGAAVLGLGVGLIGLFRRR